MKSNSHLSPHTLLCRRLGEELSIGLQGRKWIPASRGRGVGLHPWLGAAAPQPWQSPLPVSWQSCSVQEEFIWSDSLVTPLSAHSLWHLQFLCSRGQVSSVPSLSNCEIIMVGDFNLNWMEKCHTAVDSFAMDFHLTKLISQPTRLNLRVVIIHY